MKVLLGINIVLDLLLEREPFVEDATALFEMVEMSRIQGYIAATTVTNVFYIVRNVH